MKIDIDKIIRNLVNKNFPSDPYLFRVSGLSDIAVDYQEENESVRDINDGSGRKSFMWGQSKWGSDDVIAE